MPFDLLLLSSSHILGQSHQWTLRPSRPHHRTADFQASVRKARGSLHGHTGALAHRGQVAAGPARMRAPVHSPVPATQKLSVVFLAPGLN